MATFVGNPQILPNPTADPAAARIKPNFEFQDPRSVDDDTAKRFPPICYDDKRRKYLKDYFLRNCLSMIPDDAGTRYWVFILLIPSGSHFLGYATISQVPFGRSILCEVFIFPFSETK